MGQAFWGRCGQAIPRLCREAYHMTLFEGVEVSGQGPRDLTPCLCKATWRRLDLACYSLTSRSSIQLPSGSWR